MNRKRPDRATHKRKPNNGDRTQNDNGYRVTGSWNSRPDRPAIRHTQDRHHARRIARTMAEQGAYVVVEQHQGHGKWRTLSEIDGPAQAAERRAAQEEQRRQAEAARRQAAAERRAAVEAELARQAAAEVTARQRAALERLMVQPPVPRDATGRVTARHTAGAHQ
ncbi:hypothetical protein ACIBAC_15060 [Streptomyces sp. NPDC051362]|uniref:hypothetical protein n=1 Tax=Streptomyces sp. NPDC051362 TaxID=3365651 RepID=UPI0037A0195E